MISKFFKDFWPGIGWGIIVFILSATPGGYFPRVQSFTDWIGPDKIVHLILYFMLSILIFRGIRSYKGRLKHKYLILGTILVVLFGGLMELGQSHLFVGRNGNVYDFMANMIGSIIAYVVILYFDRKKQGLKEKK